MPTSHQFPLKLIFPSLGWVIPACIYCAEQVFGQLKWWPKMPWGWIALFFITFQAGAIYNELTKDNSQLKAWCRYRRRKFDVIAVNTNHIWDDADRWHTERIEIYAVIKFFKCLKNPLLVLKVKNAQGFFTHASKYRVVSSERLGDIAKDQELKLHIGTIGITRPYTEDIKKSGLTPQGRPSFWGKVPGVSIGSKEIIQIEIDGQCYKTYFDIRSSVVDGEEAKRVTIIREDEAIFS